MKLGPALFTDLAVKAGIHLPKYKGKYNAWVIAISRSEAETDRKLQMPTLIVITTWWCKAHFKTMDYKLKTLIGMDAIL